MFQLRDPQIARKIVAKIKSLNVNATFMHVCGTHQDTLVRYGLDTLLASAGIRILAGPGCPVCVTPAKEIEEMLLLARSGVHIMVYGDMLRVPGERDSLQQAKARGARVQMVYSVLDAVNYAKKTGAECVFVGVGFETTAPAAAKIILDQPPENFSLLSCHRVLPPALETLMELGEVNIQGFIQPGHVSTIIGLEPYRQFQRKYPVPQVIAGFEPLDLLGAVLMLSKQVVEHRHDVENEYARAVNEEGNIKAQEVMREVYEPTDVTWRGFPMIRRSGLGLRGKYAHYDTRKRFEDLLTAVNTKEWGEPKGCRCGEVLRGVAAPQDCRLFGRGCTPDHPIGPCMVSAEGACQIIFRYNRSGRDA